ncbi:FliG C-terminal domain-containing protein [Planctomycetes bacterium K23_9]|uniref:Flagellar motor switch protein FliG n=1 Tax=Stieleria marina TaxID=1930275 RepID=A0A517NN49_9BACT|nr:Flagellar motor switch protein FliG [Planctomycetes bacterium K23_9]
MVETLPTKDRISPPQPTLAEREESLRRVAILLSSLPAPTASLLLGKVDGYSQHVVQQAIETLHTVAPDEQREILQAFKSGMTTIQPGLKATVEFDSQAAVGVQDEIVLGQSDPTEVYSTPRSDRFGEQVAAFLPRDESGTKSQRSHFKFLESVSIDAMVTLLSGEHPQTIALVLSSISPKTAADILPQLEGSLQQQTLSRIGRLNDVPDSTACEVAQHLQSRFQETIGQQHDTSGKLALKAIMEQMPVAKSASIESPQHVTQQATQPSSNPLGPAQPINTQLDDSHPVMSTQHDDTFRAEPVAMKIAHGTHSVGDFDESHSLSTEPVEPLSEQITDSEAGPTLVDAAHQHLIGLPSQELVNALGRVSTRDALLTLCGLPNQTAESAITLLSRSKARNVRRGIESLGPLQLREIDAAKQAVAMVSIGAYSQDAGDYPAFSASYRAA